VREVRLVGVRSVLATSLAAVLMAPAGLALEPAAAGGEAPTLLAVGDSLSVGAAPYLQRALVDFRIRTSHRVGLRSPEVARRVVRARAQLPAVLVVSAGTNDDPRDLAVFSRALSTVLGAAGRRRCVVWPTIVRPPVGGATYAQLNVKLAKAARRHPSLVLVDWAGLVKRHPRWLRADGVHATAAGYRGRAAAIARAVTTRCHS
jgi:lysophospholipase L1-like esterase